MTTSSSRKHRLASLLVAASLAPLGCATARAAVADRPTLDLDGARRVAAAAVAEAHRLHAPGGAIAIVDDGGLLILLERLDDTFPAAATVAWSKARTAAQFRRPTQVFEDAITKGGRASLLAVSEMTPLQGGVPITFEGKVIGAVGVSGAANADQDTQIAVAAASATLTRDAGAAQATGGGVTFLDAGAVARAFEKGMPLLETDVYKVHASRREGAGQGEVHEADTDIIYVLSGTATFVTGGTLAEPKEVAPGEIRGSGIEGGEERELHVGDVIVVPNGVPHWFRAVPAPFTYYVVKVTEEVR